MRNTVKTELFTLQVAKLYTCSIDTPRGSEASSRGLRARPYCYVAYLVAARRIPSKILFFRYTGRFSYSSLHNPSCSTYDTLRQG